MVHKLLLLHLSQKEADFGRSEQVLLSDFSVIKKVYIKNKKAKETKRKSTV